MVHFSKSLLVFGALAASSQAAPLFQKRIAQVIADSTAQWEKACLAAGGGEKCNPVSVTAFTTLLAAAGPCDQQNSADSMIDLAKTLNNDPQMIKLTQIFAQQPRNTPNSVAVPYCQQAPKNPELNGLFQCQYQGANQNTFVGGLSLGSPGTIPFGLKSALSPLGGCKANPSGPIADGTQLVDLTQDPGVGSGGGSSGSGDNTPADNGSGNGDNGGDNGDNGGDNGDNTPDNGDNTPDDGSNCPDDGSDNGSDNGGSGDNGDNGDNGGSTESPAASSTDAAPATQTPSSSAATGGASGFQQQNGKDAQALNKKFASLTADSSCTDGDQACIGGGFAQCVGGKFAVTPCSGGTKCFALPLVNKPGTSLTCDTEADATARFAASGVSGGISG